MAALRVSLLSVTAAVVCVAGFVSPIYAAEPGDFGQYLRGTTLGDPVGAMPPPGVYFENIAVGAPQSVGKGQNAGFNVFAALDISALYWSTGWSVLGGSYAMAVAQTFYELGVWNSISGGPPFTGATLYPTVHTTWFMPAQVSWNFKNGWFASAAFAFYAPDGSSYTNTPNPDYWTSEFRGAISYLGDGWDLTAHFLYDINSASTGHTGALGGTPFGNGYRSGDEAFLDLTATKKFGKWEIGPVAYFQLQTTVDSPGGGATCATLPALTGGLAACGQIRDFGLGGLVGYDFGAVNLKVYATDSYYTRDYFGGWNVWAKIAFPLAIAQAPAIPPVLHK